MYVYIYIYMHVHVGNLQCSFSKNVLKMTLHFTCRQVGRFCTITERENVFITYSYRLNMNDCTLGGTSSTSTGFFSRKSALHSSETISVFLFVFLFAIHLCIPLYSQGISAVQYTDTSWSTQIWEYRNFS